MVPSDPLGKVLTYLDNHWEISCVVEKDDAQKLDNSDVERVFHTPPREGAIGSSVRSWKRLKQLCADSRISAAKAVKAG